ncbi:unnamed protein product, partial [Rotaria sp. Silwood2]
PFSNWKDRQNVINFLNMYGCNDDFSTKAFLTNPEEIRNDRPIKPTLLRISSRDLGFQYKSSDKRWTEQETLSENYQQQTSNHSSMEPSHHSVNISSHPQTVNHFNQTTTTTNTESFDDPVITLFRSDVTTISSIFPEINQFNHS